MNFSSALAANSGFWLRDSAIEVLRSNSRIGVPMLGLSPAYDPLGAGGRETLLRSRSNETERRVVDPSKLPQDFIDRVEACERMAEDAVPAETRETMRYLALRWRMLEAEAEAEILASVTRKPTSERPSK